MMQYTLLKLCGGRPYSELVVSSKNGRISGRMLFCSCIERQDWRFILTLFGKVNY